ncbi:MAG TPA: helix-turn-helix domain-containing protein [Puia sp.]|nr:helix-turn-helix domain-containing protein [Puia sp.]
MLPIHFLPPKSLEAYIAFYGITDVDEGFHESYVSPPLGLCGFIISLEGEMNANINGSLFLKDKYCATGQITAPMTGDIVGPNKLLMIFIQPCGLHQLFGIDMSQLTNTSMPLSQLLGKEEADMLIEKLVATDNHEKMIQVMNDFFSEQLPVFEIAPKVKDAIDYIHQQKGNVTVKQIEQNCFITARSLERHFKTYIGLSPKEYAKIFRFKCLVNFINQNPGLTWDALCEQNGYYDQSHLTRYFNRYMKIKPMELVNLDMDFINYLLQEP